MLPPAHQDREHVRLLRNITTNGKGLMQANMGINAVGPLLRTMTGIPEVSGKSGRVTGIKRSLAAGLPAHIVQLQSHHRDVNSLSTYNKPSLDDAAAPSLVAQRMRKGEEVKSADVSPAAIMHPASVFGGGGGGSGSDPVPKQENADRDDFAEFMSMYQAWKKQKK